MTTPSQSSTIRNLRWPTVALLAIAHSILFVMAFTPWGFPAVFILATPLAIASLRARRTLTLLAWTMGTQSLAWLYLQAWVQEVSVAGWPAMAIYLATWTPICAWCIRTLAHSRPFSTVPLACLIPMVWLSIEYVRGTWALGGYPWYLIGQPTVDMLPLAQVADLGGQDLAGLVPAAVGGLLADLVLSSARLPKRRRIQTSVGVATLFFMVLGYGLLRIQPTDAGDQGPTILAVQTNLPVSNKLRWTADQQANDVLSFARATLSGLEEARASGLEPDLAVWPETMLPAPGLERESTQVFVEGGWFPGNEFRDLIEALRTQGGVPLILGAPSYEGIAVDEDGQFSWNAHHNSVYLVDQSLPDARYDKITLTPFGETMPIISNWKWLEQKLLDFGAAGMTFDLDAGTSPILLPVGNLQVGTPICFEDTVPGNCRALVWQNGDKAADLLINASNDGWFGTHDRERRMHLQIARFRSIENRIPLLRVANTGITALVDSSGRIIAQSKPRVMTTKLFTPRLDGRQTLFASIGQLPVAILSILCLGSLILAIRGRMTEPGGYE